MFGGQAEEFHAYAKILGRRKFNSFSEWTLVKNESYDEI